MEQQSTQCETHVLLETVLKANEKAPKRYKVSKRFLKTLEQELKQSDDAPVTDRTHRELVKIATSPIENIKSIEQAEERVSAVGELIARDPGLFHTWMGIDTEHSRERRKKLLTLLEAVVIGLRNSVEEHLKKEVPELPGHEAGSALAQVGENLNLYSGEADDVRGFVEWTFDMAVMQAEKLVLMRDASGPLKSCIYAGILSKLKNATDLCPLDYADDLYGQVLDLLWEKKAEEFLIPGTASRKTRLRKLGERHTQIYLKSLIDKRKCVEANKHRINCDIGMSDEELAEITKEENREKRLRYNSHRAIFDMQ